LWIVANWRNIYTVIIGISLTENNERFHTLLTDGVTVEYTKNGRTKGINVSLLDVENPENNSFWVVNQLLVKENNNERRFDVVVFVML
jgi:type I restriction enzyme R subunit